MASLLSAEYWIETLQLQPHPEGGYYRETYRSAGFIQERSLPQGMQGQRNYSTAIYFLLRQGQVSRWHRIKSDELWFYHAGAPLEILVASADSSVQSRLLGLNMGLGQQPQLAVPAQSWFGSRVISAEADFSLVSCTVAPGFDFQDFQLATMQDGELCPALWKHPELMPLTSGQN